MSAGSLEVVDDQPAQDALPMFMHNVMSFAARRELLAYGHQCGRRATDACQLLSATRRDVPTERVTHGID
jgi:bacterioferritin-associated ferredoxin